MGRAHQGRARFRGIGAGLRRCCGAVLNDRIVQCPRRRDGRGGVAAAGAQAQAGTKGTSAGVSAGPKTGEQLAAGYHKGMAVFTQAIGGLMYEAAIGGQKFSFEPLK
jgi:hypothetical protein